MSKKSNDSIHWPSRKRVLGSVLLTLGVLVVTMGSAGITQAVEPTAGAVVIRTHDDMSIPDHVFKSQYERCSLPSRKQLAQITGTKLGKWGQPYIGNRQIDYAGDPDVVVAIKPWKDQELVVGGNTTNKLTYYGYGDTYVGTDNFYFRCRNSRNSWFNPNVGSICSQDGGAQMLERASHRQWQTVWTNSQGLPNDFFSYKKLAPLPAFYTPRDANFEMVDSTGHAKYTLSGYLTEAVPARQSDGRPLIGVNGFC